MKTLKMFQPKFDFLWIILALIVFCLVISLTACSPQKKLNRLLAKHSELSINNNIVITDTLYLPSTSVDTIFKDSPSDTVIVQDSVIKITYIKVKDKIYLKGETVKYPVIVTKEVMVKSPVVTIIDPITKAKLDWWRIACLITWVILGSYIAVKIYIWLKTAPLKMALNKLPWKH